MELTRKLSALFLISLFFLSCGVFSARYNTFPANVYGAVLGFFEGHALGNKTTAWEKIQNDFGLRPSRFIWNYPNDLPEKTVSIVLPNKHDLREQPEIYLNENHQQGYRAIFGAMYFNSAFWGGVLLDPQGNIIHTWDLSTDHITGSTDPFLKNMYGLSLQKDGSVIFNMHEEGKGIVKVDACSNIEWSLEGEYHHTVTPTEHGTFWTLGDKQGKLDPKLIEISADTGKIIRTISMTDVREANKFTNIFHLASKKNTWDATHANDIEPLPSALVNKFPQFEAGDLLISYRTTNTVFVIGPDSLKVKWWRMGNWDRQHDPDWEPDGKIHVFSNNQSSLRTGSSDIISIDPKTFESEIIVNGDDHELYSSINGRHQLTSYNTRLITSNTQGRVLELDGDNNIIFSFLNTFNASKKQFLHLSEGIRVDTNFFSKKFWKDCT